MVKLLVFDTKPLSAGPLIGPLLSVGPRPGGSLDVGRAARQVVVPEVFQMYVENGVEVPESALLRLERGNMYGSVVGLDDADLAEPEELERQVVLAELGPVLALPGRPPQQRIRPTIDESGELDWGAFGTVDFDRLRPSFDKVRYKADKLRDQLKDVLIMLNIVKERLPGTAKCLVLKCLRMGIIELDHIVDSDMLALAKYCSRAKRLRAEIAPLREVSRQRQEKRLNVWLELLG